MSKKYKFDQKDNKLLNSSLLSLFFLFFSIMTISAQFVHPGISHKKSDLERMKYMVASGKEPWLTSYNLMKTSPYASYDYQVKGDASNTTITSHTDFINDGFAAYYNALMWYITGDERHAEKCVEIFNAWENITRIEDQFPLNNGRGPWKMLEGAEIIKSTYSGWSQTDIDKFKAMLVYPGWSGVEEPTAAIASKDVTFYWNIYQGDPARHGNQGLFAYRSLMAMGIFLDNEIIYQRALRYLKGLPHDSNDLPYPSGPPVLSDKLESSNEYYDEYSQLSRASTIEDYGYNEVMSNYIWENGQCQESSRDQAHALGGVSIITCMCEMAWNQGDDLYGYLDNRPLLGLEFYFRYNLSYEHSYSDQTSSWEPTAESGEFIQRSDRTGRWYSLKINPYTGSDLTDDAWNRGKHNYNPIYEMNLGHYKDRLNLDSTEYKWLERGFELLTDSLGVEDGSHPVDHPGYGGLKFHRVSPGDPISGFDSDGLPIYEMNVLPMTIEAENFDYFAISGEDHTYSDSIEGNSGNVYRTDENVDIIPCTDSLGGYNVTEIDSAEYLIYTVFVPADGEYNISARYSGITEGGTISVFFDDVDKTGPIAVPSTNGAQNWADLTIASGVSLTKGVQKMTLLFGGTSNSFNLNNITVSLVDLVDQSITFSSIPPVREMNDDDIYLYASATSGLTVSISSSNPEVASISGGYLQINGVGTTTITASQEGNSAFNPATSITQDFQVIADGNALRIEAEDYTSMSGIDTQATSDIDGDLNVGWIGTGDYMQYTVEIPADGTYVFEYRVACWDENSFLSTSVNGTTVETLYLSNTGGTQIWETMYSRTLIDLTAGTNTIRITAGGGNWNLNWFKIYPQDVKVTDVSLPSTLTLGVESVDTLTATVSPQVATNSLVTWASSDTSVATVDSDGVVTAMGVGSTIITVTTVDGNKTATCNVTVSVNVTSIGDNVNNNNDISIYPNPVGEVLNIENAEGAIFELYSISGELVMKETVMTNMQTFDLSQLNSGAYLARINKNDSITSLKLIK